MFSAANLTTRLRWLYRSSSLRLTLLLSCVFALGMAIAIFLALTLGENAITRRVDATLAAFATAAAADDSIEETASVLMRPLSKLNDLPEAFRQGAAVGGGTISLEADFRQSDTWRILISEDDDGTPILIAVPIDDSEDALDLLSGVLWATTAVVVALVLIIGFAAGLLAQRRLNRINQTLNQLAAGDLHARTGIGRSTDDLDHLAHKIDATADELERLLAQTRNLSASIAHDLRTPLARLRSHLEQLPQGKERGAALEEAERLSHIFDAIMRLARIEAGHGTDGFEEVPLAELITELEDIFGAVVEDSGKTLSVDHRQTETVFADRKLLIQALANLLQNAMVHGGSDIHLFADGHTLGVADNGRGVDPSSYQDIVKPMVRLDAARESEGTGLGLALVKAVADRHGADLILSPHTPQGLCVTIQFTKL